MRTPHRTTLFASLLALAGSAALATTAQATVTASLAGTELTLTGNGAPDTVVLEGSLGSPVVVVSPPPVNDPDGGNPGCLIAGSLVCQNVTTVTVNAGGGVDTIVGPTAATFTTALNGEGGNDVITKRFGLANATASTIDGGANNDTITATGAAVGLSSEDKGGEGNDTFVGGPVSDVFSVEPGSDTYTGGTAAAAGPAFDAFVASGADPTQFQLQFDSDNASLPGDLIQYDGDQPVVLSLDGVANDGRAGEADNIGADIEFIGGSQAGDQMAGGPNPAVLDGIGGNDTVTGGPANDQVDGGEGADQIAGGPGNDALIDGDRRPLALTGDPALDTVVPGDDRLDGGPGNDTLTADLGADTLLGGPDVDTALYNRFETGALGSGAPGAPIPVNVSLDGVPNDGAAGEGDNVAADVETVAGSAAADALTGSADANTLVGGAGDDSIVGGPGNDLLRGEDGNDSFNAQDGFADRIEGGPGIDTASADLAGVNPPPSDDIVDVENILRPPVAVSVLRVKPILKMASKTIKSSTFRKAGVVTLQVTTNEPATVVGTIPGPRGRPALGTGRLKLGTGTRTLKVKLTKKSLKTYRGKLRTKKQRKKGITLSVRVTLTDTDGLATVGTRKVKIKG